jgi:hypothetical protein
VGRVTIYTVEAAVVGLMLCGCVGRELMLARRLILHVGSNNTQNCELRYWTDLARRLIAIQVAKRQSLLSASGATAALSTTC